MHDTESKPRRSLPRPRNVLLVLGLLLMVGIAILLIPVVRISMATPAGAPDTPAKLLALTEAHQPSDIPPDAPNAYDLLIDLLRRENALKATWDERLAAESEERFGLAYEPPSITPQSVWDPTEPPPSFVEMSSEEEEAARAAVNEMHVDFTRRYLAAMDDAGFFEEMDTIAAIPRAVRSFEYPEGMFLLELLLPELSDSRELARFERARAEFALREHDPETLVNAVSHMLALARIHMRQPILIERLVGIAMAALAADVTRDAALHAELPERTLDELLGLWLSLNEVPGPSFALEGERLVELDTIQWTYSDDGMGSGFALPVEFAKLSGGTIHTSPSIRNVPGLFLARRDDITRVANDLFDDVTLLANTRRRERFIVHPRHDYENLSRRYMLLNIVMPAYGKMIHAEDRFACERAGTQTLLAIQLYRARHRSLPTTLEELVPEILPSIAVDPYSQNARFVYRRLSPPDEYGRDFLLYSVAEDGEDNDATPVPGDPDQFHAFSKDYPGTDFLFTPPSDDASP
ncbi:MAG: hypothetical protein R3B57_08235 [Phycisphaerales bacterium]